MHLERSANGSGSGDIEPRLACQAPTVEHDPKAILDLLGSLCRKADFRLVNLVLLSHAGIGCSMNSRHKNRSWNRSLGDQNECRLEDLSGNCNVSRNMASEDKRLTMVYSGRIDAFKTPLPQTVTDRVLLESGNEGCIPFDEHVSIAHHQRNGGAKRSGPDLLFTTKPCSPRNVIEFANRDVACFFNSISLELCAFRCVNARNG